MEKDVLVPVTEPTEWVSQMTVVHKPSGKLRICMVPPPLNAALKCEHYKLLVLDDVLPKLKKAKVFSKLDVKEAYWHVRLNEKSSKLTTMTNHIWSVPLEKTSFWIQGLNRDFPTQA